jgi:hypothetical protein
MEKYSSVTSQVEIVSGSLPQEEIKKIKTNKISLKIKDSVWQLTPN